MNRSIQTLAVGIAATLALNACVAESGPADEGESGTTDVTMSYVASRSIEYLQDQMVDFGWADDTRSVKDYVYSPGDTE